MIEKTLFRKFYPENYKNGTVIFYEWLREGLNSEDVVVNMGAGLTSKDKVRSLKGEVKKVIGLDINPEVLNNQDLDEAHIIKDILPLEDSSVDMAYSDYVLEHIEKPEVFLREVHRILKPGAAFFFRAPNLFYYVSVIAKFSPHFIHNLIANSMRGLPKGEHEPYKTYHRLNTQSSIFKYAKLAGFRTVELKYIETEPSYMMFHWLPFYLGVFYERMVNKYEFLKYFRSNIFGRLQK